MKVIIIPGMGCTPIATCNWYSWLQKNMQSREGVQCDLLSFPDPYKCRESIWIPFVQSQIEDPMKTIIVGHSSGAACAMRLLETQSSLTKVPIKACVLVAAAHSDLGDDAERESEYFNRPWDWEQMKNGCANKIVLFHGTDDPLIPVGEARYIAEQLGPQHVDYRERSDQSHFFKPWNELLDVIDEILLDIS